MNDYKKEGNITGPLIIEGNLILTGELVVEEEIEVTGHIYCGGYSIKAGGWIKADDSIEAGSWIKADGWIEAGGWIEADGSIEAGSWIKAGSLIEAGDWIKAGDSYGIQAGLSIMCKGTLSFGLKAFAGVCTWREITDKERTITCSKLIGGGKVEYGILVETGDERDNDFEQARKLLERNGYKIVKE